MFASNPFIQEPQPPRPWVKPTENTIIAEQTTPDVCTPATKTACVYHKPPPNAGYDENPTVFGEILRGQLPAIVLAEDNDLLAFADKWPRAPLHALVIPKRYIPSVFNLTQEDLPLMEDMYTTALELLQKHQPQAYEEGDYILCFHVPPFNSVQHLHLHVLAPASKMKVRHRFGKYQVGTRWCVDEKTVRQRLARCKNPVPYSI